MGKQELPKWVVGQKKRDQGTKFTARDLLAKQHHTHPDIFYRSIKENMVGQRNQKLNSNNMTLPILEMLLSRRKNVPPKKFFSSRENTGTHN